MVRVNMHQIKVSNGEMGRAESAVERLELKLVQIKNLLEEKKTEKHRLDSNPQALAGTGDINKLLVLKSRSIEVDSTIMELTESAARCQSQLDSARRYLFTLYVRLERLRQEASSLSAKIHLDDLSDNKVAESQQSLSRIMIQIAAITGAG